MPEIDNEEQVAIMQEFDDIFNELNISMENDFKDIKNNKY